MKGNVVLKSKDRELFDVIIGQNVQNGFFSVTNLMSAYNKAKVKFGWSDREIKDIMATKIFKERVYYVLGGEEVTKASLIAFVERCENEGVAKVLKGLSVYKTTGTGKNREVYANPYIFVMLAMELSPMIYGVAVKWTGDRLIAERVEACSGYRPMLEAISTVVKAPDYPKYAIAINKKVFGRHETGMRNTASAFELSKISEIEYYITRIIEHGFVTDDSGVMRAINTYKLKTQDLTIPVQPILN